MWMRGMCHMSFLNQSECRYCPWQASCTLASFLTGEGWWVSFCCSSSLTQWNTLYSTLQNDIISFSNILKSSQEETDEQKRTEKYTTPTTDYHPVRRLSRSIKTPVYHVYLVYHVFLEFHSNIANVSLYLRVCHRLYPFLSYRIHTLIIIIIY